METRLTVKMMEAVLQELTLELLTVTKTRQKPQDHKLQYRRQRRERRIKDRQLHSISGNQN